MNRRHAPALLALASSALLLGGCVFGGGNGSPEVSATEAASAVTSGPAAGGTPVATATPRAPFILETPEATAVPLPARPEVGVMLLDISGVGSHETLYQGRSFFRTGDAFFPGFAADGSVWISIDDVGAARRYSIEDGWTDEIEGAWGVSVTPDGSQRGYYRRDGAALLRDLVIEHDGGTEVVSGLVVKHEFSPDGTQVAYYLRNEDNSADLHVIDLASADSRLLASDIDPCGCDWTPGPRWSPSGNYIAYLDYGGYAADDPDGGSFVVAAEGGEPMRTPRVSGWLAGVSDDQLLVGADDAVSLYDPLTGQVRPLAVSGDAGSFWEPRPVGRLPFVHVISADPDLGRLSWLVDAAGGEAVVSWPALGSPTMLAVGPAIALDRHEVQRSSRWSCAGVLILHATLDELDCIEGAEWGLWSDDGSYLAVWSNDGGRAGGWVGVWSPVDGLIQEFDVPPDVSTIDWNEASTHLLVIWGWSL